MKPGNQNQKPIRESTDREDPVQREAAEKRDFIFEKWDQRVGPIEIDQDRFSQTTRREAVPSDTAVAVAVAVADAVVVVVVVVLLWIHIGVGGGGWKGASAPFWIHGSLRRCL